MNITFAKLLSLRKCLNIFVCSLVKLTQVTSKSNENINDVHFQGNL